MFIDQQLTQAGWRVQDKKSRNLFAGQGIAVREVIMKPTRLGVAVADARRHATWLRSSTLAAAFSGRLTEATSDLSEIEETINA